MEDIAQLLNAKLKKNPMWSQLADVLEDFINATTGAATDEAMNAIGNPYRYYRGDTVDPRSFPDITATCDDGQSYEDLLNNRERVANVRVVLPSDDNGGAQIYMDLDGVTYVADTQRFHSRDILIQEAKSLGFDFFSDDLSDADYARVMLFISQYWPRSGAHDSFVNFLGFIRDIRIDIVQLWSVADGEDTYVTLEPFNKNMTPVWEGGTFYPTFSYDMHYDAFADTNVSELQRLFFALAPIHLVLRRMIETIRATAQGVATGAPLLTMGHVSGWAAEVPTPSYYKKITFVANTINMPKQIVYPEESNLDPTGIAVSANGPAGVWLLELDPAIALPSDPATYMRDHGIYVGPSNDPNDRFDYPQSWVPNTGVWIMAEIPGVSAIVEVT